MIFVLFFFTALKIHITTEMNDELAKIGGFKTEHRGLIDVKVSLENRKHILRKSVKKLVRECVIIETIQMK